MSTAFPRRWVLAAGSAATVGAAVGLGRTAHAAQAPAGAARPPAPAPVPAAGPTRTGAAGAATVPDPLPPLALTGVTVVDPCETGPRPEQTVLIVGDRIAALGHRRDVRLPRRTQVVELNGKYLIPGLCDMHVHSDDLAEIFPPLYLANGVTTVREMAGSEFLHRWRRLVEAGAMLGPRSVIGGPMLDGSPSLWTGLGAPSVEIADEAGARAAVRRAKGDGADFVKVYSRLSRPCYDAIVDEARRLGVPVAGHCPDAVPVEHASDVGQVSVEHAFSTWYSASSRAGELHRRLAEFAVGPGDYNGWFHRILPLDWAAAHSFHRGRAAALFARLVRNGTRQVPTLVMHQALDRPDSVSPDDDRLNYLPAPAREALRWVMEELYLPGRTPQEAARHRALFAHRLRFVGRMHRAGVPIMAGTDTGTPYNVPGFALHDELALLVRAGLSPRSALRAATLEPARFLGRQHLAGTVTPGKLADLVLLDANPLDDIRNTRRVHAVLVAGRLIDAERRERMLADVRAAAAARRHATV